jgi:hypothetical protein
MSVVDSTDDCIPLKDVNIEKYFTIKGTTRRKDKRHIKTKLVHDDIYDAQTKREALTLNPNFPKTVSIRFHVMNENPFLEMRSHKGIFEKLHFVKRVNSKNLPGIAKYYGCISVGSKYYYIIKEQMGEVTLENWKETDYATLFQTRSSQQFAVASLCIQLACTFLTLKLNNIFVRYINHSDIGIKVGNSLPTGIAPLIYTLEDSVLYDHSTGTYHGNTTGMGIDDEIEDGTHEMLIASSLNNYLSCFQRIVNDFRNLGDKMSKDLTQISKDSHRFKQFFMEKYLTSHILYFSNYLSDEYIKQIGDHYDELFRVRDLYSKIRSFKGNPSRNMYKAVGLTTFF